MKRTVQVTLIAALLLPTAATAARFKAEPDQTKQAQYRSEERERTETRYKGEQREQPAAREQLDRRDARPQPVVRQRAVVHPSFPIRREPPRVVVRRHPLPVERHYIYTPAPIIWRGVILQHRPYDHWAWEDTEVLRKWEGWTDIVLDVNDRGHGLYLELSGPTQLDFAEIVLANGHVRTVDFRQRTHRRGLYELTDFRGRVRVEYVRLVARAMAPSVRLSVRMAG